MASRALHGPGFDRPTTQSPPALRPRINVFQIQNGLGSTTQPTKIGLLGDCIPAHAGLWWRVRRRPGFRRGCPLFSRIAVGWVPVFRGSRQDFRRECRSTDDLYSELLHRMYADICNRHGIRLPCFPSFLPFYSFEFGDLEADNLFLN